MKPNETVFGRDGGKRSHKLDLYIAALLSRGSVEASAEVAGISRTTAWRWMKDPIVLARLREARRDAMHRAIARLQEAASSAVDCLVAVMGSGESESAKVAAARCVLEQALRATELLDVEERIVALEQLAKTKPWGGLNGHDQHQAQAGKNSGINGRG